VKIPKLKKNEHEEEDEVISSSLIVNGKWPHPRSWNIAKENQKKERKNLEWATLFVNQHRNILLNFAVKT
jgi:hypothetical protein